MGGLRTRLAGIGAAILLAGPPLTAAAQAGVSVTYAYDALGRVTQAAYSNGVTITYSYDAAGNRTSRVLSTGKVVVVILGGAPVVIPVP
jgi:YD repeat-containing protein